jgi:predicted nucleic acid-binding protein
VVLVDTNILVAAARSDDDDHEVAAELMRTLPGPLLVPPTVVAEVCYMLHTWGGPGAEVAFLRSFRNDWLQLAKLTTDDLARMADLAEQYADLGLGGTDASVIAMAERLGIREVATLDRRHFTMVRPAHVEAFTLLP